MHVLARRRARTGVLLGALVAGSAALLVLSVAPSTSPSSSPSPSRAAAAGSAVRGPADDRVRRVVAISVDGLSPTAIRDLGRRGTPTLHRLMRHGAATLNARTVRESTSTLPNHTGMVTGRRVTASAGGHGVEFNTDNGATVHDSAGERVASVFSVVHDHGGRTALYAGKGKFHFLDRSWSARFAAPDRVGRDHGRDKIDRYVYREDPDALVTRFVRQLRRHPATFVLLHLRLPDSAGHEHGYLSRPYLRAVRRTDALLGRVVRTIARRPALRRHTVVVLTADHGGHAGRDSSNHADPRRLGNYRVPFVVWGASVARGADLYRLNRGVRRDPGVRRTTYRGPQPVRNAEVANLATDLLDLGHVPGSRLNRSRDLDVHTR